MAMKKTLLTTLAALTSLQAAPALAENYEVNLNRKGSNVYKIDGKDIIIQTRYCYVYAYSEEAIFKTSGYGGEVIFFDSKDKCDVKAVFGVSKQKPGKYVVTVSREDEIYDWFVDKENAALCDYAGKPFEFVHKVIRNVEHYLAFSNGLGYDGMLSLAMDSLKRLAGGAFSLHYLSGSV
jgi:hypothetical protein